MLETITLTHKQSPTDAAVLDSFVDLDVLVLRCHLIKFPYRQADHMEK